MGKKILVIDDEHHIRFILKTLLTNSGHNVLVAESGQEGLKIAKKELPDIIFCDIMMPVMSGYEVLEKIREDKATRNIVFISISAREPVREAQLVKKLGVDEHIVKPFNLTKIQTIITRHFKR